jgi:hypothetical protein
MRFHLQGKKKLLSISHLLKPQKALIETLKELLDFLPGKGKFVGEINKSL